MYLVVYLPVRENAGEVWEQKSCSYAEIAGLENDLQGMKDGHVEKFQKIAHSNSR